MVKSEHVAAESLVKGELLVHGALTMICRIHRPEHFAIVPAELVENPRLSMKAKGIMAYLLSKPDKWEVYQEDICKHCRDGREAIATGFQELIAEGYVVRGQRRTRDGRLAGYEYVVHAEPQKCTVNGKAVDGKPATRIGIREDKEGLRKEEEARFVGNEVVSPSASNPRRLLKDRKRPIPTLDELHAFGSLNKLPESSVRAFWNVNINRNWKSSGSRPIKDWQSALVSFVASDSERSMVARPPMSLEDFEVWAEANYSGREVDAALSWYDRNAAQGWMPMNKLNGRCEPIRDWQEACAAFVAHCEEGTEKQVVHPALVRISGYSGDF